MNNHINNTHWQLLDLWDRKFSLPNSLCLERDVLRTCPEIAFSLICFDIVSLRTINDALGRKAGDMLLFAIRDWIASLNLGQLYRLESDEFGLLIKGADMETALEKARHISGRFSEAWEVSKNGKARRIFCSVSMGVIPSSTLQSHDDVLNVIERILKTSSEQANIAVYDEETNRLLKRQLEIEISLIDCVKNGMRGFSVSYQPIVNSITGLWCALEALCRWTSPTLGQVSPGEFIPIAEHQGLVGDLGEWVLEESVRQCKAWRLDTIEDFFLDVNLSPIQLQDENLDTKILDILKRNDYPSHKLSLEITESVQLNFNNHTLDAISRLTQQNIPVALDDFGTGYASFHSLMKLPVSVLKIEKVFVDNIENDEYLQRLLETIVSLAHGFGMKMTVEGVESAGQMKILMDNRVDYVQGYLFSRPLSSGELAGKLKNFYHKDENSVVGGYSRIDIDSLLSSENAYSLPAPLYRTLMRCMQILFNAPNVNDGINSVLALVGERLGVNRHVLFLKDKGKDTFTCTHEWCDECTSSHIERFKSFDIANVIPNFIQLFEREGIIVAPDVSSLPDDIYQIFLDNGIKSNIDVPLWRGKELLGYVGLDVCHKRRNWLPEEVLMVHSVCGILANVLDRIYLKDEINHREWVIKSILNNMDIPIYVSDLETNEILFANGTMQKELGTSSSLVGKICWKEVHQCKASRCEHCKLPQLPVSAGHAPIVREHLDELTGRRYIIYDCIIQWKHNQKAHLQYMVDITRFKQGV